VDANICPVSLALRSFRIAELEEQQTTSKPWGQVIVAALIVNLVTLIGVVFIAGEWLRKVLCPTWLSHGEQHMLWTHVLIPMFACGALLATTFFLVLPEGLLLIQADFAGGGHEDHRRYLQEDDESGESAATWRFGAAILGGFLIPVVSHALFPHEDLHSHGAQNQGPTTEGDQITSEPGINKEETTSTAPMDIAADEKNPITPKADEKSLSLTDEKTADSEEISNKVFCAKSRKITNPSLMASIFLGDFFHNFADGVFLGSAFLLCDESLAITIAAATIFHELAQEVADYFILVHHCGMSRVGALLLNFSCGLSIMLGGIIVLSADLSSSTIGVILCIGGGVYVHVSVAECLTTAKKYERSRKHKAYGILAFVVGVVPIGLVLLNHQHCAAH
jgi:zinc transporter ZupT